MSLTVLLTAQKALRQEQNTSVPDKEGNQPITLSIGGKDMNMSNRKGASWKKILTKVKDYDCQGRGLAQQFDDMKNWLESAWAAQAKCP